MRIRRSCARMLHCGARASARSSSATRSHFPRHADVRCGRRFPLSSNSACETLGSVLADVGEQAVRGVLHLLRGPFADVARGSAPKFACTGNRALSTRSAWPNAVAAPSTDRSKSSGSPLAIPASMVSAHRRMWPWMASWLHPPIRWLPKSSP